MSDVFSLFDEEVNASKFDKVDGEKGSTLSNLIRQSMEVDQKIAEAEQYLKDLKFHKRKVNEEDIPNLMQEMGMDSVTVDGNKVALRQFVHARIPDDKKDEDKSEEDGDTKDEDDKSDDKKDDDEKKDG